MIAEHKRLTDAIHEGGCRAFVQLNHAESNGIDESVSASNVNIPIKRLSKRPRKLSSEEILCIEEYFATAAARAASGSLYQPPQQAEPNPNFAQPAATQPVQPAPRLLPWNLPEGNLPRPA